MALTPTRMPKAMATSVRRAVGPTTLRQDFRRISAAKPELSPRQVPLLSILGADLDIGAGGVLDRFELAVARVTRRHFATGILGDPALPHRPPRIGYRGSGGEPLLRCRRVVVVLPVPVLAARRVDDAGDMARSRQYEFDRALVDLRCGIGRPPWGD